ncbi:MAG: hypothetical protein ACRC63_02140, partial [Metamycoplasmataceae bacterium]
GLQISYDVLIEKTMIPKMKLYSTKEYIGKNTQEALNIGIIEGHRIVIEELSKNIQMPPSTIYLYSGGNAHYFNLKKWKYIDDIDVRGLYLFSLNR